MRPSIGTILPDMSTDMYSLSWTFVFDGENVLRASVTIVLPNCISLWIIKLEEIIKVPSAGVLVHSREREVRLVGCNVHEKVPFLAWF